MAENDPVTATPVPASNTHNSYGQEGHSTVRPPFFTGTNYTYWKIKMMTWMEGQDLWDIVEAEYTRPTVKDPASKALIIQNAKAMTALFCAIDANEFNRISTCKSAHEIWNNLKVTHEGTNKVKQSKICLYLHKYELFKMQETESVEDMIGRFTDVTNALEGLGKVYTPYEKVLKVLGALTDEWAHKMTAIEESNDLSTYSLEELFGNLKAYQLRIKSQKETPSSKKKEIAFKATTSNDDVELDNETMAMLVRNYKKMFNKGTENSSFDLSNVTCYNCNKTGHLKKDCPQNQPQDRGSSPKYHKEDKYKYKRNDKNKYRRNDKYHSHKGDRRKYFKKKAYAATWDDSSSSEYSSSSESDNGERANLCFMALGDNTPEDPAHDSDDEVSKEELLIAHHTLFQNFTKLYDVHKVLKKDHEILKNSSNDKTVENLKKENETLLSQISTMSKENKNSKMRLAILENNLPILNPITLPFLRNMKQWLQTSPNSIKGKENWTIFLAIKFLRTIVKG